MLFVFTVTLMLAEDNSLGARAPEKSVELMSSQNGIIRLLCEKDGIPPTFTQLLSNSHVSGQQQWYFWITYTF